MRRILVGGTAMLFALSSFLLLPGEGQEDGIRTAEASATIRVANRELKRNKRPPTQTDIYERAHRIIWSGGKSYDDRVRIAVVINGDENIIVEDRVKNQVYSQLRNKFPRENFAVMKGTDVNTKLLQYAEDVYYDQRETAVTSETHYEGTKSSTGINFSSSATKYDTAASASAGMGSDSASGTGRGNTDFFSVSGGINFGDQTYSLDRDKVTKPSRVDVNGMPVGMQPRGLSDMRCADYVRAGQECDYDYVFAMTFYNGKGRVYNHDFVLFNTSSIHKNVWMCVRFVDVANREYMYRNDIVTEGKTHNGHINGRVIERSVKKAVQEAMDDIAIDY